MSKIFVKQADLSLVNGGYLVTGEKETPVFNKNFIKVQKHAEWVVTFAEKAKGKDFEGKVPDTIDNVRYEVEKALSASDVKYVAAPKEVKGELNNKLKKEALAFINFDNKLSKVNKINNFLQQFNTIQEFEEFGLYFEEDICKLTKVYTMKEIIEAVISVINLLD